MNKQIKIGMFLSIVSILLNSLIQIFYTPVYIKYLGTSDYGINSLIQVIISYIGLLNLGLGNVIIKYILEYRLQKKYEEEAALNGVFIIVFSILMLISIIALYYVYRMLPDFFSSKFTLEELLKTRKALLIVGFNLVIGLPMSIFSINIISYEKFFYLKCVNLIKILLVPVISYILMRRGYGLLVIITIPVILNMIIYLSDILIAFKLGMKIKFKKINIKVLKEIFLYSSFIFLSILVDRVYWGTDKIIIGKYLGSNQVAIYSIANIFIQVYLNFSVALSDVFFPKINILVANKEEKKISNLFLEVGRIQYIILLLICLGFFIFGKEFIIIWLGSEYLEIYRVTLCIMIPLTIPLSQNIGISIIQAKKMHYFRAIVYSGIAILNIINSIQLVKKYGILGCAIATSFSFILGHIVVMNIYYAKKVKINIFLFWKTIAKITFIIIPSIIISFIFNMFFKEIKILFFIIKILFFIITYNIFVYKFILKSEEKNIIKKYIKVKIRKEH